GAAQGAIFKAEDRAKRIAETRRVRFGARGVGERFAEAAVNPEEIDQARDEREGGGNSERVDAEARGRRVRGDEIYLRGEGAEHGAGDEAKAEGGADEAH